MLFARVFPFLICAAGAGTLFAQEKALGTKGPLTLDELERLKQEVVKPLPNGNNAVFSRIWEPGAAEPRAIADFLRKESEIPSTPTEKLDRFYGDLARKLGPIGSQADVSALVQCLVGRNQELKAAWWACAEAIVGISNRAEVPDDLLRPLFQTGDPHMDSLAEQVRDCVRYEHLDTEKNRLSGIGAIQRTRQDFQKRAEKLEPGKLLSIAKERGFDFSDAGGAERIEAFFRDCGKRLDQARDARQKPREDAVDEALLQYLSLEELVKRRGLAAFDFLVEILEGSGGNMAYAASGHLHDMTGRFFPFWIFFSHRGLGSSVCINAKAAGAWRKWKTQWDGKELPKPDASAMNRDRRIADFNLARLDKKTKEYVRPSADILEELSSEQDAGILEILVAALSSKKLEQAEIASLIETAGKAEAGERRNFLLLALYNAQADAAFEALNRMLGKDPTEEVLCGFLDGVSQFKAAQAPFLISRYQASASEKVQDAVLKITLGPKHPMDRETKAMDAFIDWLLENGTRDEHKIRALKSAQRAGINTYGYTKLDETLKREKSERVRMEAYTLAIGRTGDPSWVVRLLENRESETVQMAAFRAYRASLEEHSPILWGSREDEVASALRAAVADPVSDKTRDATLEILAFHCRKVVSDLAENHLRSLANIKLLIQEYETMTPQDQQQVKEMLAHPDVQEMETKILENFDGSMERIRKTFGSIPDEAKIKKDLGDAIRETRRQIDDFLQLKGK